MIAAVHAETFRQSIISHAFPHGTVGCYSCQNQMVVEGLLPVSTTMCEKDAKVQVSFDSIGWLKVPPRVVAMVDWLQPRSASDWNDYAEWHRYPNGELCWTRIDRWRAMISEDPENIDRMAASLVKDITVLLRYHLLADSIGITKWQRQWPFYKHGSYKGE